MSAHCWCDDCWCSQNRPRPMREDSPWRLVAAFYLLAVLLGVAIGLFGCSRSRPDLALYPKVAAPTATPEGEVI